MCSFCSVLLYAGTRRTNYGAGDILRDSGRRKRSAHLVGEGHLIRKTSKVLCSHIQTVSPSEVGQPRPRVGLCGHIVIGKHDAQHVSGQAVYGFAEAISGVNDVTSGVRRLYRTAARSRPRNR
jgi:hypothetical protein